MTLNRRHDEAARNAETRLARINLCWFLAGMVAMALIVTLWQGGP